MTPNRPLRPNNRASAQRGLTVIGTLAVIIAIGLIGVIVVSVNGANSQNATLVAQIPTLAVINNPANPIGNAQPITTPQPPAMLTVTPAPSVTSAQASPVQPAFLPTFTPAGGVAVEVLGVTATPVPVITGTPVPLPPLPFTVPASGRAFYMPRLDLANPVPIVDLPIVNQTWNVDSLQHNVGHLDATNWLDAHEGNVVLVGHIQLTATDFGPFLYLNKVVVGDLAYVTDNGQVYTYQVTNIRTVNPTDVTVTYMTPDPVLTLITCTTWDQTHGLYSQRLVVTAKLVNAPAAPTT